VIKASLKKKAEDKVKGISAVIKASLKKKAEDKVKGISAVRGYQVKD
jgi:hypothetical protein